MNNDQRNLVNLLPIAGVFAGIVGAPVISISLAFIAAEYGLEKLSQPEAIPEP